MKRSSGVEEQHGELLFSEKFKAFVSESDRNLCCVLLGENVIFLISSR